MAILGIGGLAFSGGISAPAKRLRGMKGTRTPDHGMSYNTPVLDMPFNSLIGGAFLSPRTKISYMFAWGM
jgi:hypothetical protein